MGEYRKKRPRSRSEENLGKIIKNTTKKERKACTSHRNPQKSV